MPTSSSDELAQKGEAHWQSAKNTRWATPQDVFDALDAQFNFVVDLAAEKDTAKCGLYITKEIDVLTEDYDDWAGEGEYAYQNPPYGKATKEHPGVIAFVKKTCEEAHRTGVNVVMLLHAKTDTKWWHKYCWQADEIWEVQGRIAFIDPDTGKKGKGGAPCGQAVVIFRRDRLYDCDGPKRKRVNRQMEDITDHRR